MRLFLGVDGGQSSTTALIGDEAGRVLGVGAGGPCNHVGAAEGAAKLARAVGECVGKACEQAGLDAATVRFEAACFGMSGGPEDKVGILSRILRVDRLVASNDAVIALAGATAGEPGIITISGTGSIAFGRNPEGRTARAGGWGYIFGDEGGGFDIVRQALRASLRAQEGWGPATALGPVLLEACGAADVHAMLHLFYTQEWPRWRVAKLAKLVDRAAGEGDRVAKEVLAEAARQLAGLACAVRGQLWHPGETARLAYIGGVFRGAIVLQRFRELVAAAGCVSGPPVFGPAAGALLEAYRAAGLQPPLSNVPEFKT